MLWNYWQQDWLLSHKVIFDGSSKRIYIDPSASAISAKEDLYSASKEWLQLRDNAKFLPPFRTIGGDPVGGGLYAGDIYFLINDWQIVIEHNVKVSGTIYHDNPALDPFIIEAGGGVTSSVSNLAYAYNTTGVDVPTVQEVAEAVWAFLIQTGTIVPGSAGEMLVKKLLTTNKFIGLK